MNFYECFEILNCTFAFVLFNFFTIFVNVQRWESGYLKIRFLVVRFLLLLGPTVFVVRFFEGSSVFGIWGSESFGDRFKVRPNFPSFSHSLIALHCFTSLASSARLFRPRCRYDRTRMLARILNLALRASPYICIIEMGSSLRSLNSEVPISV